MNQHVPMAVETASSDSTRDRAGRVLAGGVFGTFRLPGDVDFVVQRGSGPYLYATDGRVLVDHVLASGPMILGHSRPEVQDALREQIKLTTTSYVLNETALELAERVKDVVPAAESVKLVGDGSAANFFALRLARAYTGRTTVLKFEGAFHGYHDDSLHAMRPSQPGALLAEPDSAGIPSDVAERVVIAPFNDLGAVESLLEEHAIAAVIVEPVQRAIVPAPGFLQGLRGLTCKHGALLVFDELVTGFRLSIGGAQQAYGVVPDLCALGKILGGGLPLAAVVGRSDILELSSPARPQSEGGIWLSGTLNGNPLAAAAGLATLNILQSEPVYQRVMEFGTRLRSQLLEVAGSQSVPLQIIGPPCMIEPLFSESPIRNYEDYSRANAAASRVLGMSLIRRGVFVNPGAKWYVSAAHTDRELEFVVQAFAKALDEVRASGTLG